MNKKKKLVLILVLLAIILLVLILPIIENRSNISSIHTLFDSFWFLICTITTVGYGDLYPVTFAGKLISLIFILISAGLFTLLISFFLSIMLGKLPTFLLRYRKKKQWIIFTEINEKTLSLAGDLKKHMEKPVIIFLNNTEDISASINQDYLLLNLSLEDLLKMKGKDIDHDSVLIFVMGRKVVKNYSIANDICTRFPMITCFCETTYQSDISKPSNQRNHSLFLFNCYDLNARNYWKNHPILKEDKNIVLIGDGDYASSILSRSFLGNVLGKEHRIRYHIFGNYEEYLQVHHCLGDMVNILKSNQTVKSNQRDSYLFYEDSPYDNIQVLAKADRIIICQDDDFTNQKILSALNQFFATKGVLHVKSSSEKLSSTYFGNIQSLYSEQTIINHEQDILAHRLHHRYVNQKKSSGLPYKTWEELEIILKLQNITAADHLLTKAQILLQEPVTELTREVAARALEQLNQTLQEKRVLYQEIEHERWMRFFCFYNFSYGKEKDFSKHTHPNYIDFEDLDEDTRSYDDNEWKLFGEEEIFS